MFLVRLVKALEAYRVKYAIVGGFAMVLHGVVRGTLDIDLVVTLRQDSFEKVEKALNSLGLSSRLPVNAQQLFHFREEFIKQRNLIAWSFANPQNPSEVVDIILPEDLGKITPVKISFAGVQIKVLPIPELLKMKRRAGREQDLADVKALELLQRKMKNKS
jgi:hypothetical protein